MYLEIGLLWRALHQKGAYHVGKLLEDASKFCDRGLHIVKRFCSAVEVGVLLGNHQRLLLVLLLQEGLPAGGSACQVLWINKRPRAKPHCQALPSSHVAYLGSPLTAQLGSLDAIEQRGYGLVALACLAVLNGLKSAKLGHQRGARRGNMTAWQCDVAC